MLFISCCYQFSHLLLGCGDLDLGSSPFAGSFSQLRASSLSSCSSPSTSSGCCTSRWMWLGEDGQGEAAEEHGAGESWVEEEEDDEEEDPR